jgi:hypothetical protein
VVPTAPGYPPANRAISKTRPPIRVQIWKNTMFRTVHLDLTLSLPLPIG